MSEGPSTLILDLDGTLIDSRPVILECFARAVQTVIPRRDFDAASIRLGPPIRQMFQISFPDAMSSELDSLLRAFRYEYDQDGPARTLPYDGALEVLAHCQRRGIVLDVATNKPWRISAAILARLKMDHFFRTVLGSDSVQPPFANKSEMLLHLLQAHRLNRAETWFVGDSSEDAAACAACGLRFVWAAYGYGKLAEAEAKGAFATIRRLGELPGLLG